MACGLILKSWSSLFGPKSLDWNKRSGLFDPIVPNVLLRPPEVDPEFDSLVRFLPKLNPPSSSPSNPLLLVVPVGSNWM